MRKSSDIQKHPEKSKNRLKGFKERLYRLFTFPVLSKKKWLDIPLLGKETLSVPNAEHFEIEQQETKDSCGRCTAKMIVDTLLRDNHISKHIDEKDIVKDLIVPKLFFIKKTLGITPNQLKSWMQALLDENKLAYTAETKYFVSYPQIKQRLRNWSQIMSSYMWDTIDNPHKTKDGQKDGMLRGVHHPHYCVLLKIDEAKQTATIANPFGYKEELPFKEFRERISLHPKYLYSNSLYSPLVKSGLYMPRSCVVVSKNA